MANDIKSAFERIALRGGRTVWRLDGWAMATDGHLLVAVDAGVIDGEFTAPPEKIADTVRRWLAVTPDEPVTLSITSLRDFAQVAIHPPACVRCNNQGRITCPECHGARVFHCECESCGNEHESTCSCTDGTTDCPECRSRNERIGTLLSRNLNTVLLKDMLETLATDDRTIAASVDCLRATRREDYDYGYIFRPVGDGMSWFAVLMPMNRHVKPVCAYQSGTVAR